MTALKYTSITVDVQVKRQFSLNIPSQSIWIAGAWLGWINSSRGAGLYGPVERKTTFK